MASYVVPQVEIHQLFSELPISLTTKQVPFVFGPNYLLHRYSDASEKANTYLGTYDHEDAVDVDGDSENLDVFYPYPDALDEDQVDKSYTKLYGDNVLVKLGTFSTVERVPYGQETSSSSDDGVYPSQLWLTIDPDDPSSSNDTVSPEAKEIVAGRSLRLRHTGTTVKYDIVTIRKVDYDNSNITQGKYLVYVDQEFDADVAFASADLCEVQDGVEFARKDVTDTEAFHERFWNEYENTTKGTETYGRKGIRIEKYLVVKYEDADYRDLPGTAKYGVVISAELYLTYRELITSAADTVHSLVNASEVTNALGTVSPDNPLAQAVYNAALNAGGQTIRYMAVPVSDLSRDKNDHDTDIEGYSAVLNAVTLTREVYFFVPVTRDGDILDLVKSHVNSMSAPTTKRWRIAFVSAEIPEKKDVYDSDNDTNGKDFYAYVKSVKDVANKHTADIQFTDLVEDISGTQSIYNASTRTYFKRDVKVGDIFYTKWHQEWGVQVPYTYKIVAIVDNNTIRVENEEEGHVARLKVSTEHASDLKQSSIKAEIKHPYTNAEKADVIKNLSSSFADRRMYNVFPSIFSNNGVQMTGEFAAACVAGLVSACLPQQPVTNLALTGIDDIPLVYQTFTYDQLNTIASGGTFIVMQDLPNDEVYVRHQISTAYEDNNLNTAELSITKNLDSISFFFDDLLSPYIGKYNITPELLDVLRNMINKGLVSLESNSYGLYGSQVIAEGTEIQLLEQDDLLKDHVNCTLKLNLPYPFNHLVLKLFV